jgi:hypothetical protein
MSSSSSRKLTRLFSSFPISRRSDAPRKTPRGRRLILESLEDRRLLSINPFISEILGDNESGIVDSAGNHTDWLEICNPNSQQAVDLTGWNL